MLASTAHSVVRTVGGRRVGAYVVLEDIARDVALVDARVLVRLEMGQGLLGHTLMGGRVCKAENESSARDSGHGRNG